MRPITWLASYPRSGNTYLRALIGNYLYAKGAPLSLVELTHVSLGEHDEERWRALTGKSAADRTVEDEWQNRPAYYAGLRSKPGEGALLTKTHTVNSAYKGEPAFQFQHGDRVIHLVRHPGDVAISVADFYGIELDEAIDRLLRPGLCVDGRPKTGFEILGSWEQHARSWLEERRIPVLTLRYFDLVTAPAQTLNMVIPYIGFAPDRQRVDAAVEFARFDRLQAQEASEGFVEASHLSTSGRFFRQGRAAQWPQVLSADQIRRLVEPHQELLDRLGLCEPLPSEA